jgi:hypothetical protein
MAVKVAINGFGRIGRLVFRAIAEQGLLGKDVEVVAVGDIVPADNLAYLLKYDSTQGRFAGTVGSKKSAADKTEDDVLIVNGKEIFVVSAKTPAELPWKKFGVDVVIESTGLFTDADKANPKSAYGHITAGAKKVIISAPAKNEDITLSWASTTRNTTRPSTPSFPTRAARRTASRRRPRFAQGRFRHRGRFDDDDPQLHRHAKNRGRSEQKRLERRTQRGHQYHSRLDRRGESDRARLPRSEGQAHRHVVPRADADGFRR